MELFIIGPTSERYIDKKTSEVEFTTNSLVVPFLKNFLKNNREFNLFENLSDAELFAKHNGEYKENKGILFTTISSPIYFQIKLLEDNPREFINKSDEVRIITTNIESEDEDGFDQDLSYYRVKNDKIRITGFTLRKEDTPRQFDDGLEIQLDNIGNFPPYLIEKSISTMIPTNCGIL